MRESLKQFKDRIGSWEGRFYLIISLLLMVVYFLLLVPTLRLGIKHIAELLLQRTINNIVWDEFLLQKRNYLVFGSLTAFIFFAIDVDAIIRRIGLFLRKKGLSHKWIRVIGIVLIWSLCLALFLRGNIQNPNFWFDESGQFWMAKGLNHYSDPFQSSGGIRDVLENNAGFNLDPGGFTVILHLWTLISTAPAWLRFLPMIFFLASMILVTKLSLIWHSHSPLPWFSGLLLLTLRLPSKYALELRPYSMEMCSALLSLYCYYQTKHIIKSPKFALIAGISLGIMITSRYSALIFPWIVVVLIFFELIQTKSSLKSLRNFGFFCFPILVSSILILLMLHFQNPSVNPPTYVLNLTIKEGNLSQILFNLRALVVYLPFLIFIFLFFTKIKRGDFAPYRKYLVFSLFANGVFLILSILGKYPWSFTSRFDISINILMGISILPLLVFMVDQISLLTKQKTVWKMAFTLLLMVTIYKADSFKFPANDSVYENILNCGITENMHGLANINASPTIRYLFEYGPLQDVDGIYRNIDWFNDPKELLTDLDDYDYLILSHFSLSKSELDPILKVRHSWDECSNKKPSYIYLNRIK